MTLAAPIPVLIAIPDGIPDADWEAGLVAAFERTPLGVTVVRRCVDLADLLATATTGIARVAIVSAGLRRLDRDALARLAVAGVAVVGVAPTGDEAADRKLRQVGVSVVLPADAAPADIAAAVVAASRSGPVSGAGFSSGSAAVSTEPSTPGGASALTPDPGAGRLVAVWGPTGAPGRTSVAVGLASEMAALGVSTLLVDADVYGGVVAQVLGLLEEMPGLAAACRLANTGALDLPRLGSLARAVGGGLRVLPGISRPARWPELRPAAFGAVLDLCRSLAAVTVIDCGFSLEQDEELSYDTAAPRRNGATLAALEAADTLVVVGSGDPIGVARLVRGLADLRDAVPAARPLVVVNRCRRAAVGGDPEREVGGVLARYAGVTPTAFVPYDVAGFDAALAAGRTLAEVAPGSSARAALRALAASIVDRPLARQGRLSRRQRSA